MKRSREWLLVLVIGLAPWWCFAAQDASLSQLSRILSGGEASPRRVPAQQAQTAAAPSAEGRFSVGRTGGTGLPATLATPAAQRASGSWGGGQAAAPSSVREVIGKGYGMTREEALDDACRNAVECAVGLWVDSETLVENFELKKDEILTQSNGYIVPDGVEIMWEGPSSRGHCIQIKAKVKVQEIAHSLRDIARPTSAAPGDLQSLLGTVTTQDRRDRRAIALLNRELDGLDPVRQLFGIRLVNEAGTQNPSLVVDQQGKPKMVDGLYTVRYLYEIYPLTDVYFDVFVPRFTQILEQISVRQPRTFYARTRVFQERDPSKPDDTDLANAYREGNYSGGLRAGPHYAFIVGKGERKEGGYESTDYDLKGFVCGREQEGPVLSVVTMMNASLSAVTVRDYFLAPAVAEAYAAWDKRYFEHDHEMATVDYFLRILDKQGTVLAQTQFSIPTQALLYRSAFRNRGRNNFSEAASRIEWVPLLKYANRWGADVNDGSVYVPTLRGRIEINLSGADMTNAASVAIGLMEWAQ